MRAVIKITARGISTNTRYLETYKIDNNVIPSKIGFDAIAMYNINIHTKYINQRQCHYCTTIIYDNQMCFPLQLDADFVRIFKTRGSYVMIMIFYVINQIKHVILLSIFSTNANYLSFEDQLQALPTYLISDLLRK